MHRWVAHALDRPTVDGDHAGATETRALLGNPIRGMVFVRRVVSLEGARPGREVRDRPMPHGVGFAHRMVAAHGVGYDPEHGRQDHNARKSERRESL
jgi:hypothetical protein